MCVNNPPCKKEDGTPWQTDDLDATLAMELLKMHMENCPNRRDEKASEVPPSPSKDQKMKAKRQELRCCI